MNNSKVNRKSNELKQEWVQFDDDGREVSPKDDSPAVLDTEAVQVTLENNRTSVESAANSPTKVVSTSTSGQNQPYQHPLEHQKPNQTNVNIAGLNPANLQNVPLNEQSLANSHSSTTPYHQQESGFIRQGFANGDVIVTILPQNTSLPWITPATFRPELVPEELMAQGLTLTVEDYVHVMSQLVNDHRFTIYNICYKRVLMAWITLAFFILLCILFGNFPHMVMFGLGIAWLMVNAGAIFFCMWIKIRLNKNLEKCLSRINLQLMKHKILLGCDDRGKISCHKLNLVFIYFDPQECIDKLQKFIDRDTSESNSNGTQPTAVPNLSERFDMDDPDIIITGTTNTRITQQQNRARFLLARYSQRWVKLIVRGGLSLGIDASERTSAGGVISTPTHRPVPPRHMATRQCPCQYIEDHLQYKPQGCLNLLALCP